MGTTKAHVAVWARSIPSAAVALALASLPTGALAQPERAEAPPAETDPSETGSTQDGPGAPEESQERSPSDDLIDEGVELRTEGREREALERFREAYELAPSPRARAQMGLAEKSLRSYLEAEAHLDEALASDVDPWVAKNRVALEAAKAFVAKQLAWIQVTSNVPGAELRVNGAVVGVLPLRQPHRVVAGHVVLEARAEGYATSRQEVALAAEETTELALPMTKLEPKPKADVAPSAPRDVGLEDEPASWTPWIISTGALGLVGLAVGTGLGVRALQLKAERDDICPEAQCDTTEGVELDDEGRAMAVGSTIAFTVGGLAAATSLVLWLVEPDGPSTSAWIVPRGNGVAIRF